MLIQGAIVQRLRIPDCLSGDRGSIPRGIAAVRGHSSAGRARLRHGRGRGFESRCPLSSQTGHGHVAQMAERSADIREVGGSSPPVSTARASLCKDGHYARRCHPEGASPPSNPTRMHGARRIYRMSPSARRPVARMRRVDPSAGRVPVTLQVRRTGLRMTSAWESRDASTTTWSGSQAAYGACFTCRFAPA